MKQAHSRKQEGSQKLIEFALAVALFAFVATATIIILRQLPA
jgi:hypothetical protein